MLPKRWKKGRKSRLNLCATVSNQVPSPAPAGSSHAFAALQVPGYGIYLIGSGLAMTADSIEHVISYWIVFQKFQSPALGGYAVISHWVPFLLFSVSAGALADRFDPRRIIQAGMLLFIGCLLGWGVLFMAHVHESWDAVVL